MANPDITAAPTGATGVLVLADGSVVWGKGFGAAGDAVGELCFNTSMTGYQEIMTDPSYAGQVITFTFPHIGNVGTNPEDVEADEAHALGCVVREDVTDPSNFRSSQHFVEWMAANGRIGLAGVDTRALTRRIREAGAPNVVIAHNADGQFDMDALLAKAREWAGLEGTDLAKDVTRDGQGDWTGGAWTLGAGYEGEPSPLQGRGRSSVAAEGEGAVDDSSASSESPPSTATRQSFGRLRTTKSRSLPPEGERGKDRPHVVAIDYGAKHNIFRNLVKAGAKVTVVPVKTSLDDILALKPDGVFLSNGPGDPAATGEYAVPVIAGLLERDIPLFGICLGHQMLALAAGAKTTKMHQGHRGANHPVKRHAEGVVEITSMNHGFAVDGTTLPDSVRETHVSLFDGSNCGIEIKGKRAFGVQYHPEASPGPMDSFYLFEKFVGMLG